jgi:dTDP-4-amino-4,6-dideoxygalactose transaminase
MSDIIKFLDLQANYNIIKTEIDTSIFKNITNTQFISGNEKNAFEKEFADYIGVKYCIGVGNGTDALEIGIQSLDFEPGSEILTQPNSFIATALGISTNNLKPVFVDIEPDTLMIDHTKITSRITSKTKAICIVHLYGTSPNITEILRITKLYNLKLIEDCAQSHGSLYNGKKTGTFGDIACFSFYPGKNLGCFGDGGAILTNSLETYNKIKLLHNLGSENKYYHEIKGRNSRLDNIQAGILRVKLKYLDINNVHRQYNASIYYEQLKNIKNIKTINIIENCNPVWHLYIIRVLDGKRDVLQKYLKENNIETGIHYPIPIHKQKAYIEYNNENYPNTELVSSELLSLPMYPELEIPKIIYICATIKSFFEKYQ